MQPFNVSETFKYQLSHSIFGAAVGAIIIAVVLAVTRLYLGFAEFDSAVAWILRSINHAVNSAILLTAVIYFIDFATPGDWLVKVGDDPKSAGNVTCCLILGTVYLLCYG